MTQKRIPERSSVPDAHKWDLGAMFASEDEWERLYETLDRRLADYRNFAGRLHESADTLRQALAFHLAVSRQAEKLYTYAHLRSDEDKANQHYLGLHQKAMSLFTRLSEQSSFISPEIQSIPDARINAYLQETALSEYRFFIEKIIRYKPHTLSLPEEKILAMSQEVAQAPRQIFGQLDNVDLDFGTLADESGRPVELSHGNFQTFLIHPRRDIRKNAFLQYYDAYERHKNTLAAAFTYSVKKDVFYARVRNYPSCRYAGLYGDAVPESVYDNLVGTVREGLPVLHKYLRLRRSVLDLEDARFYDTYVPLVADVDFHMTYEAAVAACVEALVPLGAEYTSVLEKGLLGGWVDRYENRGKRSGAYSSGCYDSPPYILLNHQDGNIGSLYTLAHEAGHSMHSYFARRNQPYVDHEYTIFVAEVASTFNEDLLSRYLLERYADNPRMKAYVLNRQVDNIRATLFRQTMFAEFETIVHAVAEQNRPLTLDVIADRYMELLETYFGDTIVIDRELALECLRIPHFYSAFYVYKYATGVSAAVALADKVIREGDSARDAYLDFLKLGGSRFPLDQLMTAGVDMRSPGPIRLALQRFDQLVDELAVQVRLLRTGPWAAGAKNRPAPGG